MKKRVHTKASDWLPIIEAWKKSGLNKKVFCEQQAINYKTFYRWQTQLSKVEICKQQEVEKKANEVLASFIPVKVLQARQVSLPSEQCCTLLLNNKLRLEIPVNAISADFLRLLVEVAGATKPC